MIEGPARAVNALQSPGWKGLPRGDDNAARIDGMAGAALTLDPSFPWLRAHVLNDRTRLVFAAEPASGAFVAQGREADGSATQVLSAVA